MKRPWPRWVVSDTVGNAENVVRNNRVLVAGASSKIEFQLKKLADSTWKLENFGLAHCDRSRCTVKQSACSAALFSRNLDHTANKASARSSRSKHEEMRNLYSGYSCACLRREAFLSEAPALSRPWGRATIYTYVPKPHFTHNPYLCTSNISSLVHIYTLVEFFYLVIKILGNNSSIRS